MATYPPPAPTSTNLQMDGSISKDPATADGTVDCSTSSARDHKPTHSTYVVLSTSLTNTKRMFITNSREDLDNNVTTKAM